MTFKAGQLIKRVRGLDHVQYGVVKGKYYRIFKICSDGDLKLYEDMKREYFPENFEPAREENIKRLLKLIK